MSLVLILSLPLIFLYAHTGDLLQAKIAQEVPLPDRRKVKLGSIVQGSVSGVALAVISHSLAEAE